MLTGRLVLITRPEPGASDTAALVAALGLVPVIAPLLHVRALAAMLPDPGAVQAVLVASGHALAAIPPSFHAHTLLAVGEATAARARARGFAEVHSADGDAAALVALAARRCRPGAAPLLLAAGRGQSLGLAAALRAEGFPVLRRAVYATRDAARLPPAAVQALSSGGLGAALFFSAGTARIFVRLAEREAVGYVRDVAAVAIAAPTAAALTALPWRAIHVAMRPNQEEMLALLQ